MYNKATKEELARNYDQAFGLYIKATEVFLHLSRSATQQEREKANWKANAQRALERAEKIKGFIEKSKGGSSNIANHGRVPQPKFTLTPVGINHFSPRAFPSLTYLEIKLTLFRGAVLCSEEGRIYQWPRLFTLG